jgi:hypothetical protein
MLYSGNIYGFSMGSSGIRIVLWDQLRDRKVQRREMKRVHYYHKPLPRYLILTANVVFVVGIVMVFWNWRISIPFFITTLILWLVARRVHKKKRILAPLKTPGFHDSVEIAAKKYELPEKIAELRTMGFTDEEIERLQRLVQEDAKKGVIRKMDTREEIEEVLRRVPRATKNNDSRK